MKKLKVIKIIEILFIASKLAEDWGKRILKTCSVLEKTGKLKKVIIIKQRKGMINRK